MRSLAWRPGEGVHPHDDLHARHVDDERVDGLKNASDVDVDGHLPLWLDGVGAR